MRSVALSATQEVLECTFKIFNAFKHLVLSYLIWVMKLSFLSEIVPRDSSTTRIGDPYKCKTGSSFYVACATDRNVHTVFLHFKNVKPLLVDQFSTLYKGALLWYGKLTWESAHARILKILFYLIVWGITLIFMVRLIFYAITLLIYDVMNESL